MLWSMELYEVASLFGPFLVELNKLRTLLMVFSYFRNPNPTIDIRTELCAIEFVDVIYYIIVYDHHIFFCFSYEEPATVISVSPAIKLTEQWFLGSLCNSVNMSLQQSVCCFICFAQSQITGNKWANYSTHALVWYQSLQNNWVTSVNKFLLSLNHCLAYGGMIALRWGVSIISFIQSLGFDIMLCALRDSIVTCNISSNFISGYVSDIR